MPTGLIYGMTTIGKAAGYERLMPLLETMLKDFQDLAKKKSDGVLNRAKILAVNALLKDVFAVIQSEENAKYLKLLEEDDVPQYSDVVILLGQTVAAMGVFHDKFYGHSVHGYGWAVPAAKQ